MKTAVKTKPPRPSGIRFAGIIVFDWRCPACHKRNTSQRPSDTEYLNAKCGHCHAYTYLDYHRATDAPPAARRLDSVALGCRTTRRKRRGAYR